MMLSREVRIRLKMAAASVALVCAGCTIVYDQPPAPPPGAPAQESAPPPDAYSDTGPVFDGPGVVEVDEEPPPDERVYVYDPGFPPGCYFYGGYYWYHGYRYDHDAFIHRYVDLNIRAHRFVDVDANRRAAGPLVERQRLDYTRNGGHRVVGHPVHGGPGGPGDHGDWHH